MKLVIFAGGIGTRLWPLSRENSPKQFEKIFSGKSTIQLAFDRVAPTFGAENIFIQTVEKYKSAVKEQLSQLKEENIFIEPERRNVGPAVCFSLNELKKRGFDGPVAILWADHLMERSNEFVKALKMSEKLIIKDPDRFVFLAERSRSANNNLGWIKVGTEIGELEGQSFYEFSGWKYKPEAAECYRMFRSGEYFWNPGYFITSVDFLLGQYKKLAPEVYNPVVEGNYHDAEAIHFDKAIAERLDLSKAVIIKTNMGWSDPGTLFALKEALEKNSGSNVTSGEVETLKTSDCLIYNFEKEKILAAVGLKDMVVVNTEDALIIVGKDDVVHVTELIEEMKKKGLDKYL